MSDPTRTILIPIPVDLDREIVPECRYTPRTRAEYEEVKKAWECVELSNENADTRNRHLANLCRAAMQRLTIWLDGYSSGLTCAHQIICGSTEPQQRSNASSLPPGVNGGTPEPVSAAHG